MQTSIRIRQLNQINDLGHKRVAWGYADMYGVYPGVLADALKFIAQLRVTQRLNMADGRFLLTLSIASPLCESDS